MWDYAGDPDVWDDTYPGGFDGIVFKYPLRDGQRGSFTVVKIGRHAWMKASARPMTRRSLRAVDTGGRSEVDRFRADPMPARVIEVGTTDDPVVTHRDSGR